MYLPIELIEHVFSYLEWQDAIRCRTVCKYWVGAEKANFIWNQLIRPFLNTWVDRQLSIDPKAKFWLSISRGETLDRALIRNQKGQIRLIFTRSVLQAQLPPDENKEGWKLVARGKKRLQLISVG
jgi:hypothetical protein